MNNQQEEKIRILLVEDDATIATQIQRTLEARGFQATCARDFSAVMETFEAFDPQLVLMDISLPQYNGYYWCSRIREKSAVPIIFISSHNEDMDIVLAMQMGGDDYITKPFSMDVLIAKIQAVLRRTNGAMDLEPGFCGATLSVAKSCVCFNGQEVELTRNELRILQTLLEKKGAVVSRDLLMQRLWDTDEYVDDNTLSVNVNRLRKKLGQLNLQDCIATRKGEGYILNDT
ncbi:response regulator transcription factor [Eubacteriales bacterium OttesenSCG-928-K08]|nr:response regulator transcription factor [Eubacteriales bacterium OttesenSCG-928-K08]